MICLKVDGILARDQGDDTLCWRTEGNHAYISIINEYKQHVVIRGYNVLYRPKSLNKAKIWLIGGKSMGGSTMLYYLLKLSSFLLRYYMSIVISLSSSVVLKSVQLIFINIFLLIKLCIVTYEIVLKRVQTLLPNYFYYNKI